MRSPTTTIGSPVNRARTASILAGSTAGSAASGADIRDRCIRQRDEDEKQHQELGIAEVVFKLPSRKHGDDRRQPRRGEKPRIGNSQPRSKTEDQRSDQPEPNRQRRKPPLGGDLHRNV